MDKKYYPNDLKLEILDKVKSGQRAVDVAQSYGIKPALIYKWASANLNPNTIEISKLKRENQALKDLVADLSLSIANLKKR